ncbi:hypothetical protein V493_08307 [Pseudogymnoascus sp. VKM F-4281 (FW-2241)]|nr:hypothetical protein V493_08307 [Pseudogymnoascus sp. VKM F-4281 (FW-2241)]
MVMSSTTYVEETLLYITSQAQDLQRAVNAAAAESSDASHPIREVTSVWILCVSIIFVLFINAWAIRAIRQRMRDQAVISATQRAESPASGPPTMETLSGQGQSGPYQLGYQLQALSSTPRISASERLTAVPSDSSNYTERNDGRHPVAAGNVASVSHTPDQTEEQLPKYTERDYDLPDYANQNQTPAHDGRTVNIWGHKLERTDIKRRLQAARRDFPSFVAPPSSKALRPYNGAPARGIVEVMSPQDMGTRWILDEEGRKSIGPGSDGLLLRSMDPLKTSSTRDLTSNDHRKVYLARGSVVLQREHCDSYYHCRHDRGPPPKPMSWLLKISDSVAFNFLALQHLCIKMPPLRCIPPPAKAIKTERTHEENQERAYIAASRRSDRSLEARVESAKRASEIHKRRTGRSLRVSEEDVINEEMYEEEEDDLPHQYRCLTAHLHSQTTDFNHQLSDYLTNHVAMRSALEGALRDSYATQAAQEAGQVPNPYPSVASVMNAQMGYQAHIMGDNHPSYAMQNIMPTMPIAIPHAPAYLHHQQFQSYDPQPRLTQSLHNRRQYRNQCQAESVTKCQQSAAVKSPSPVTSKPDRGKSVPVEIKSESPALQSIEQSQTPISRSYEPRPKFSKRPGPANFNSTDSSITAGLSCDKSFMPQVNIQAADGEFNPFATATPQDDGLFDANLGFPNDPMMGMFMAGNEALNAPHSFDSSLDTSYSGTPARKLDLGLKTHVGGLDSTVSSGIAPAQLESAAVKKGLDVISGVPARLKNPATGTASTSATGTPGIAPDKWNEWIDPGEWEGGVQ